MLQGLCHARQLLVTQGTDSFKEYFARLFEIEKKDPKKTLFLKSILKTAEYKSLLEYIDESLIAANHPKLRKLAEILTAFFTDPSHH